VYNICAESAVNQPTYLDDPDLVLAIAWPERQTRPHRVEQLQLVAMLAECRLEDGVVSVVAAESPVHVQITVVVRHRHRPRFAPVCKACAAEVMSQKGRIAVPLPTGGFAAPPSNIRFLGQTGVCARKRPIATDLAWSTCMSLCLRFGFADHCAR